MTGSECQNEKIRDPTLSRHPLSTTALSNLLAIPGKPCHTAISALEPVLGPRIHRILGGILTAGGIDTIRLTACLRPDSAESLPEANYNVNAAWTKPDLGKMLSLNAISGRVILAQIQGLTVRLMGLAW